ncbi:hypothetical protein GIB67_006044 [Kingdonia uniflora]|uniref:DC1 domain-containing protein n=1 Tax=Kingdonia uniflora TaxID=39325 RepID=A0A7J7LPT4_9MAGN|nr:hypothetical protein GIB67_006044 [Kingdonia uniflora]
MGSNHWLYRCTTCEFDAHIGCATAKPSAPQQHQHLLAKPSVPQQQHQHLVQHQYQSFPASNHIQTHFKLPGTQVGSTVPLYQPIVVQSNPLTSHSFPGYCHTQYQHQGAGRAGGMQRPPARQQGDSLMQMAIESFVDAASQQAGQTAVQDLMGIGGNGADPSSFLNIEW